MPKSTGIMGIIERQKEHPVHSYRKMKRHQVIFWNAALEEKITVYIKYTYQVGSLWLKQMLLKCACARVYTYTYIHKYI